MSDSETEPEGRVMEDDGISSDHHSLSLRKEDIESPSAILAAVITAKTCSLGSSCRIHLEAASKGAKTKR